MIAARSVSVLESPSADAPLVTEVVPGEALRIQGQRHDWLQVVVPDHATHLDASGYPGWVAEGAPLVEVDWWPNALVVNRNATGIPLGSLLERVGATFYLPGGANVEIETPSVRPLRQRLDRTMLESVRLFEDLPYRWGGTDSTRGTDCSGLVYRVMQCHGVHVPRDAEDQFYAAPFRSREHHDHAGPGDLVFFGDKSITHVGFCLGDGSYVSETRGGTAVRKIKEDPYWGFARYEPHLGG